jgi:putative transcriptional regulator
MESEPGTLQGALMLADPSLRGSVFERTVLLLTAHGAETGTQGLVLNQPMGQELREIVQAADLKPLEKVPVYSGGPVSPGELMLVALRWNPAAGRVESRSPLGIAAALRAQAGGWEIRAFVGYTGWSAGQLEDEFKRHSWMLTPHRPEALHGKEGHDLWRTLLCGMGPWHTLVAGIPDDPGLN